MILKSIRPALLAAGLLLCCGLLFSQAESPAGTLAPDAAQASAQASESTRLAERLAEEPIENTEEEENAQFKYSPIVRGVAQKTGFSKETVFWSFLIANFAILAGGAIWIVRKIMPHGFAPRQAEIQKAIEEARKASAEADARLGEIEGRLSRLDSEIAEIRAAAEGDFSAEEQRIKADAERDAQHVVEAAEQEISAAARSAQRDLKAFAAGLAVDLAEKKIKVDGPTDEALVKGFAERLGKDGGA
jgi:F-type H+-transporting ATPase subunit b